MDEYNGRRQFYRTKTKSLGLKVLVDFKENPKAAQEHTKNPMMMNKIQKVVNVGIFQMRLPVNKDNDTLVLAYDTKDQIHNVVLTKQMNRGTIIIDDITYIEKLQDKV
ncbi:stress-induced-phosphoprotein 1 [Vigna unguiculata]|uniref:Stress-induced-phosphoprotein 1 n=1 Tax=Vigna unguiculata TaxID=3917 RepID=A0A4D6MNX3_VIGUN|nr:stress-induced-phosphoprotein 1 [Vigna unguiculata]